MARRTKGTGSIKELPNGKFRMRQKYGLLKTGNPRVLTVTGNSRADCEKKMRKKLAPYINGLVGPEASAAFKKLTLGELCSLHLNEHLDESGHLKPKAADRRESTIRNQIERYPISRLQVSTITPQDINTHIEKLIRETTLSVSSIEKTFNVINSAFNWAREQYYTNYNPCDPVRGKIRNRLKNLKKKKASDGVVIVLSDRQRKVILEFVENMDDNPFYSKLFGLSVLLLIHTGIRVGELSALRWKDWYSDDHPTLNIDKTRNVAKNRSGNEEEALYRPNENEVKNYHSRTLALSNEANTVLRKMHEISPCTSPDDYILINRSKTPSNPSNYDANAKRFYERAGLAKEVSGAHILRRSCATDMWNNGCRLEDIAAYLGDTPEVILKYYIATTKKVMAEGKILNVVPLPEKK